MIRCLTVTTTTEIVQFKFVCLFPPISVEPEQWRPAEALTTDQVRERKAFNTAISIGHPSMIGRPNRTGGGGHTLA